jgi:hypothetical protein
MSDEERSNPSLKYDASSEQREKGRFQNNNGFTNIIWLIYLEMIENHSNHK